MREVILQKLEELQQNENMKILFCCESGSRAWGFPSPDSDFDVRFVYMRPRDWYLSIDEKRDVIELPVNEVLDINGWDIRKALRLYRNSNAVIYEWIQSPVIYMENGDFRKQLLGMGDSFYSPRAGMHHYLSMAKNCLENDLNADEVRLKKYFYALRPMLACKWIADNRTVPPMEFKPLLAQERDAKFLELVNALLEKKKGADERMLVPKQQYLNDHIAAELIRCSDVASTIERKEKETAQLDELFREMLKGY